MLQDAHRAQEISGEVSLAVKDERWGDATRHLIELQEITSRLMRMAAISLTRNWRRLTPTGGTGANAVRAGQS